jgi:atlastin
MTEDAVLVEYPDREEESNGSPVAKDEEPTDDIDEVPKGTEALQIVSIGTEEDKYAFTFHKDELNAIMSKIPPGWKVSVVSVVGAFRTGKSFLLSWFLRYLDHLKDGEDSPTDGKWYEKFDSLGNVGFSWRGGAERNTTGIWMWSEPHFIQRKSGEHLAVILVDTQGMFDNETTMALTASIFGLSTLLSSYQIYNVDKRIQEDNLQQLALFSEYARMAMSTHNDAEEESLTSIDKPFQQIEFLVRDWQNFEEEDDLAEMEREMEEYLEKVVAERDAKDLQDTREQILTCFQTVSCYGLVHPGMEVTKKKYSGDISAMDETFLKLVDRYCSKVFDVEKLSPKIIHGRELTAVELGSYIQAYAELFVTGANFPEAATLLDATSKTNNNNAVQLGIMEYKDQMDRVAGPHCSNYVKPDELTDEHKQAMEKALEMFKSIANFGNQRSIDEAKEQFTSRVDEHFVVYTKLNEGRNPLAGLET